MTIQEGLREALPAISVYCDASVLQQFDTPTVVGAWAFVIPSLQIEDTGLERGIVNTDLEMLAAIQGCERVLTEGYGHRFVIVCSDCGYTEAWVKEIVQRERGITKRTGLRVSKDSQRAHDARMIARLKTIVSRNKIQFRRVTSASDEMHRRCHCLARKALRDGIPIEERRQIISEQRIETVRRQREKLIAKLAGIDEWLRENDGLHEQLREAKTA